MCLTGSVGIAAGVAFFGVHLYWIARFGWYALLLLALGQAFFMGGFTLVSSELMRSRPLFAAVGTAGVWVGLELLRGVIPFGGFPWAPLGSSLHNFGAARSLSGLIGKSGLSGLIVMIAILLLFVLAPKRLRPSATQPGLPRTDRIEAAAALALIAIVFVVGACRGGGGQERWIRVAVVQAGIEAPWNRPADPAEVLQSHVRLTSNLQGKNIDLIVWGENVVEGGASPDVLVELARRTGVPISAGVVEEGSAGWRNLVVAARPDGARQRYSKQRPVPFGEYVPIRPLFGGVPVLSREVPRDMERGTGPVLFSYPFGLTSPVVSYESAFPGIVRKARNPGAELIEVHTNNSSFGRTAASEQHLALDKMRAAELGAPIVRAAITGISAVIDGGGRVLGSLALYERGILIRSLGIGSRPNVYSRYGDLTFAYPLVALASLRLVLAVWRGARRRSNGRRGGRLSITTLRSNKEVLRIE